VVGIGITTRLPAEPIEAPGLCRCIQGQGVKLDYRRAGSPFTVFYIPTDKMDT
jgi:hypothetical protein